jgi:hypothetical protein
MHRQNADRAVLQTDGIVRRVDPVGRELEVAVAGTPVSFDIRTDCAITLRGERVKLRLLQPRDRVRVTYTQRRGALVADTVEVQPVGTPSL